MLNLFTLAPELIEWIDDIVIILGVISGIVGKFCHSKVKAEKELTKVINEAPLKNEEFLKIAEDAGLKGAAVVLSKLIK